MNWDEWSTYLEELIGHRDGTRALHLLVPQSGEEDLSEAESAELATLVHQRLFLGPFSWQEELARLRRGPINHCLPLLYLSRWIARQQETNIAFWPQFSERVVKGRLSPGTVQQGMAPLLTDLWWKLHREWGIYRPREGRVYIKWPQAHAGFTEGERDQLIQAIVNGFGWSEEPPPVLYQEPDEFLHLLRTWLRHEVKASHRLERLILGADGPALIASELIQSDILTAWPPGDVFPSQNVFTSAPSPYVQLRLNPLSLRVLLPSGTLPGHQSITARLGEAGIELATTYSADPALTRYPNYEWQITEVPWARDVALRGGFDLDMRIKPECPFQPARSGAMMFDPTSGRPVRRWRPGSEYLLLLEAGSSPRWLSDLFVGVEAMDVGTIGDVDLVAFFVIGADLPTHLGLVEASQLLQELEIELQVAGALIALPDAHELLAADAKLVGGALICGGHYARYLSTEPPLVLITNHSGESSRLALFKPYEDSSVPIGEVKTDPFDQAVLFALPESEPGSYRLTGLRSPIDFELVADYPETNEDFSVALSLRQETGTFQDDDLRHLRSSGVEISAWPFARVVLHMRSEAGSVGHLMRLDSSGKRLVRGNELQTPSNVGWVALTAFAWLAHSNELVLNLRPTIFPDAWVLNDGRFHAQPDGVSDLTECQILFVNTLGRIGVQALSCIVSDLVPLEERAPDFFDSGWIIVGCEPDELWLVTRVGRPRTTFDGDVFDAVRERRPRIGDLLRQAGRRDEALRHLCALFDLARLAQEAAIPDTSHVPKALEERIDGATVGSEFAVELPWNWGGGLARIEFRNEGGADADLVIENHRFRVTVSPINTGIKVDWRDTSSPCRCLACGQIMSLKNWYERCQLGDHGGMTMLSRSFIIKAVVGWREYVEALSKLLLTSIDKGEEKGPAHLISTWTSLQEAYKARSDAAMSPHEWIGRVVESWKLLHRLVRHEIAEPILWFQLWSEVSDYELGIKALSLSTR